MGKSRAPTARSTSGLTSPAARRVGQIMSKPRLQTLKPRLQQFVGSRVQTLAARPDATPRLRGRKWMERRASWLRLHPLCCDCAAGGVTRVAAEVDHVIPLWQGGADDETNYASRCVEHHAAKTSREARDRARGV